MKFKDNVELLRRIKNESEDLWVLSDMIINRINHIEDKYTSEDLFFEDIIKFLDELFNIKENLSKDVTTLKRKTKGI